MIWAEKHLAIHAASLALPAKQSLPSSLVFPEGAHPAKVGAFWRPKARAEAPAAAAAAPAAARRRARPAGFADRPDPATQGWGRGRADCAPPAAPRRPASRDPRRAPSRRPRSRRLGSSPSRRRPSRREVRASTCARGGTVTAVAFSKRQRSSRKRNGSRLERATNTAALRKRFDSRNAPPRS